MCQYLVSLSPWKLNNNDNFDLYTGLQYTFIALTADTEDDLQILLYNFYLSCLKFNTKISIHKTKAMTISKEPIRCK